ncbi:hypothetical protein ASPCAL02284 [Aspergillus calidoustus]|uniref:Uncharacterized protein n=1 Tax=Aspergillus calidoustus TaxID=454130 RepID=A0A0U5GL91_ASPCI|nr:hypothetical protein ASPCAL02284 [Aspergillus calidoustus]
MASLVLLLLVTGVIARTPWFPIALESPTNLSTIPTDDFVMKWPYSVLFNDDIIIGMAPATTTQFTNMTRVYALYSSTTVPATFLPALHPGQTSVYTLQFFTTDSDGNSYGTSATDITLSGPVQMTVTHTRTLIDADGGGGWESSGVVVETPAPIFDPQGGVVGETETDGEGETGLLTGAKAGIGIGVACAVLLLAVGGVVVYRRRQRRDAHSGIPKKTPFVDQNVDMSGELQSKHGAAEAPGGPARGSFRCQPPGGIGGVGRGMSLVGDISPFPGIGAFLCLPCLRNLNGWSNGTWMVNDVVSAGKRVMN